MDISADQVRVALFFVVGFVVSTAVHEFGHAFVADRLGDRIPRLQGRLTLSPMPHIDPVGTLAIPLLAVLMPAYFPFLGWGKPVLTNPSNYTSRVSRKTGSMLVAAAGPFMNLVLAVVVSAVVVALGKAGLMSPAEWLIKYLLWINIILLFFNLIPIGPLDGAAVLAGLLPPSMERINYLNRRYGMLVLLALFFSPALRFVMEPVFRFAQAWEDVLHNMVGA